MKRRAEGRAEWLRWPGSPRSPRFPCPLLVFVLLAAVLAPGPVSARQTPAGPGPRENRAEQLLDRVAPPSAEGPAARRLLLPVALGAATLVSEDLTCIASGLLVARRRLSFFTACAACYLGIFIGDLLLVLAGRLLGEQALRRRPLSRWVKRDAVERAEKWFLERGTRVVFLSRFVPGSRLPLFLGAGILRAPILPIAGALALAGLLWTPLLVGLSAWTGGAVLSWFERFERLALPALALAALASWLALKLVVPLFSWRGRRLLLSRWRRLTKWEFWPAWLFQAPVFLNVLRLAVKHGGIGTFTAANPGIPAGGFVEESKSAILAGLEGATVARYARATLAGAHDARVGAIRGAMRAGALGFPVVLKPDVGERGKGVAVVREAEELAAIAGRLSGDWIVQEYVHGEEFGVFYVRHPDEPRGRIFSITAKRFPRVTGDGRRPLEELILADDRAVCMAALYLEVNAARLDYVPAPEESIQLVEIGNHCRGTVFLDGSEHATDELTGEIDRIARAFPGFYFGRFDLRTPTVDDLRAGRNLTILELNGVTSEATHIYHPGASLLAGWRTLFVQWRLAFEIGSANVKRGAPRARLAELVSLLRSRRRRFATIEVADAEKGPE
jgi:membrane protein DedA with SNARE-associated domain